MKQVELKTTMMFSLNFRRLNVGAIFNTGEIVRGGEDDHEWLFALGGMPVCRMFGS